MLLWYGSLFALVIAVKTRTAIFREVPGYYRAFFHTSYSEWSSHASGVPHALTTYYVGNS